MNLANKHIPRLWLAIILLSGALLYAIISGRMEQAHRNDALRTVVCFAEDAQLAQARTAHERNAVIGFWSNALSRAHLQACYPVASPK